MARILQNLESDQAILLMYLADELSAVDREEVDRRLESEPVLRQELEELHTLQGGTIGLLLAEPAPAADEYAVRRVVREMRRFQLERAARSADPVAAGRRRIRWWAYPLASAAAAVFVLLALWGMDVIGGPGRRTEGVGQQDRVATQLMNSFAGAPTTRLDDAETQLSQLDDESPFLKL